MREHRVRSGRIAGRLEVPGSRSITNRALVVAALAGGRSTLDRPLDAEDTDAMRSSLRALGIRIGDEEPAAWTVEGSGGRLSVPSEPLDVGASGTTARFITAVASLVPGPVTINGSDRMRLRPITDLVDALHALGAEVDFLGEGTGPPLRVDGPRPTGRSITIDATRSSQYVSAVAMIAPMLEGDTKIRFVDDVLVSRPYVEMTLDVMAAFGAECVMRSGPEIFVRGSTGYRGTTFVVEPDMSAAVYPAAAAAVTGGSVEIVGISESSRQADLLFFDVLEDMGCVVDWTAHGVQVTGPRRLTAVQRDMNSAPDAALMLAVVCAFADGVSTITNVANLRIKESDRLTALREQLAVLGIVSVTTSDSITIEGGAPHGGVVATYDDHRIAMSFAVAGVAVPDVTILDPDCVSKTWPEFFTALDSLTASGAGVPPSMIVALDGPGGSGKTTASRAVGERLDLPHLDTGAFYRAATLVVVEASIDLNDTDAAIEEVSRHQYGYSEGRMIVDDRDVSSDIRTDAVTRAASPISAIPEVRLLMVAAQRKWVDSHGGSAVVEGRDIGTVVFPDADLKVYLTARAEVRAARRASEQGHEDVARVAGDLERRDSIDSTRADSPLTSAEDALILDTSEMTIDEVVDLIVLTAGERQRQPGPARS
jgi:3-phosphoshikimate 1-carboxyvinyltransferase